MAFIADIFPAPLVSNRYGYKIIAAISENFSCAVGQNGLVSTRGVVLNRNVDHSYSGEGTKLLLCFVEPESYWGKRIGAMLAGRECVPIEEIIDPQQLCQVFIHALAPDADLSGAVYRFLDLLLPSDTAAEVPVHYDFRIVPALQFIHDNLQRPIELFDIADLMSLSPDRARHLFVEQVGLPLSQYLLWQRLRKTLYSLSTSQIRLSQAINIYGFSDQSHFTRAFKSIFGIPPRTFLGISRLVF